MPPVYLFHAAPFDAAMKIAGNEGTGLKPLSGKEGAKYLCMSEKEDGAITLQNRANDVKFRVLFSALDAAKWKKDGAGKEEWRSPEGIAKNLLEYRRNLGTAAQKAWKSATLIPLDKP